MCGGDFVEVYSDATHDGIKMHGCIFLSQIYFNTDMAIFLMQPWDCSDFIIHNNWNLFCLNLNFKAKKIFHFSPLDYLGDNIEECKDFFLCNLFL